MTQKVDAKRYDLSRFGRYKYNKKLGIASRLAGHRLSQPVIDPLTGEILADAGDLVDFEAERKRLTKEKEGAEKKLSGICAKLSNPSFLAKAPEAVVNNQREEEKKLREKIRNIEESLAALQ